MTEGVLGLKRFSRTIQCKELLIISDSDPSSARVERPAKLEPVRQARRRLRVRRVNVQQDLAQAEWEIAGMAKSAAYRAYLGWWCQAPFD
jgi:hypothetical protein